MKEEADVEITVLPKAFKVLYSDGIDFTAHGSLLLVSSDPKVKKKVRTTGMFRSKKKEWKRNNLSYALPQIKEIYLRVLSYSAFSIIDKLSLP